MASLSRSSWFARTVLTKPRCRLVHPILNHDLDGHVLFIDALH
jgi:hypothetical protein